jgi:hypothetical protein
MTYDQWKTDSGYAERTPEEENEGRPHPLRDGLLVKPLEWARYPEEGMPCGMSDFVDVTYRDGTHDDCVAASALSWSKTGHSRDIVGFRIVPSPAWKSEAAEAIKNAYIEGSIALCEAGERRSRELAERNFPYSQANSDAERILYRDGYASLNANERMHVTGPLSPHQ